ncbi:MAG: glycosyltransferase family 39 protein [Bacteroidota bacterium]
MRDIRTWIFIFFLVRMYGIAFPPLEIGHNWRQTDGLMIARNFYERDANIFYPRVDTAGANEGFTGSEFPILNYIVYLFAKIFGFHNWLGRLVVLITSCLGVYFFHKLIAKRFDEKVAFNAAIILTVSLWFSFSRKMIPDVFAASLAIMALYFGYCYLREGKLYTLALFLVLGALGCLSKILAASILTVMLFPMLDKSNPMPRKILTGVFSVLILAAVYCWYFVWVPHLQSLENSGHFFMGYGYFEGLQLILKNGFRTFGLLFMAPIKYIGFVVFVASVVITVRNKDWLPVWVFLVPLLSFLIVFIKTGSAIVDGDNYYVLTMIPSMAFIAGYALANFKFQKIALAALIIISIESLADQVYDFRIKQQWASLASLEEIMDGISDRNDLIAINCQPEFPTIMYMAHRRGWSADASQLLDVNFQNEIRQKGCKYVVVAKQVYGDLELNLKQVYNSDDFRIYSLTEN